MEGLTILFIIWLWLWILHGLWMEHKMRELLEELRKRKADDEHEDRREHDG